MIRIIIVDIQVDDAGSVQSMLRWMVVKSLVKY